MNNLNLGGDWHKPEKKGWDKQQREDWLYMVLPSIVLGVLLGAALVIAFYKFIVE